MKIKEHNNILRSENFPLAFERKTFRGEYLFLGYSLFFLLKRKFISKNRKHKNFTHIFIVVIYLIIYFTAHICFHFFRQGNESLVSVCMFV